MVPGDLNGLVIGGARVLTRSRIEVLDPATGMVVAEASDARAQELDSAFDAAAGAFAGWSAVRDDERRSALGAAADALFEVEQELATALTLEQGKPMREALLEVRGAVAWFRYYAGLDWPEAALLDDDEAHVIVGRRAKGPVAALSPWSFPLILGAAQVAPALRAGNTVVLKPSRHTPLSSLMMGETAQSALPPGVLNVVTGGDRLSAMMISHPSARAVCLGCCPLESAPARAAVIESPQEIGGNDAAVILDDAEPDLVAAGLFAAGFFNNGQGRSGPKRVYVPKRLFIDLTDALAARARGAKVGPGQSTRVDLGPLVGAQQRQHVANLVTEAVAAGATAVTGGSAIRRPGFFYQPTILVGVDESSRVVRAEQLGPVLPVMVYSDLEEVMGGIKQANAAAGASVWGADEERNVDVARRLDLSMVWINTHSSPGLHQPAAPGRRYPPLRLKSADLEAFTDPYVVYRAR